MQPRFLKLDAKKVVGLGTPFISILSPDRNSDTLLPALWERYLQRRREIRNAIGPVDFGLCEALADPALKTHPDELFYMACTEVASLDVIPPGMTARLIPPGRYAAFTHRGKLDQLARTMTAIYDAWLPNSGEERRDAPELEVYGERFRPGADDSELEILVPIV